MAANIDPNVQAACDEFRHKYAAVRAEVAKAIVGHDEIVDGVLTCLFTGGHALLEGVPVPMHPYRIGEGGSRGEEEAQAESFQHQLRPLYILRALRRSVPDESDL